MNYFLIDTHAHLNDEKFENRLEEVLENAKNNNVERTISVGYNLKSSKKNIEIAKRYENVFAVIGMHPDNADEYNSEFEKFLKNNAGNKKVLAIGEIGLDYHYFQQTIRENSPLRERGGSEVDGVFDNFEEKNLQLIQDIKSHQKKCFIKQLEIAYEVKLPVVIHSRDATGDMLEILKAHKNLLKHGGIMHCFNESAESMREFLKLGLHFSFGGNITFKNSKNAPLILNEIPKDKVLLETDCPYLCPDRGQINEPKYIKTIAEKIAQFWNMPLEEVAKITTENAFSFFKKLK